MIGEAGRRGRRRKEFQIKKEKFIHEYRKEIGFMSRMGFNSSSNSLILLILEARNQIGYSETTQDCDIWFSLVASYNRKNYQIQKTIREAKKRMNEEIRKQKIEEVNKKRTFTGWIKYIKKHPKYWKYVKEEKKVLTLKIQKIHHSLTEANVKEVQEEVYGLKESIINYKQPYQGW